jgi:diacylglycerol kinase
MNQPEVRSPRSWITKFRDAFRGVWVAARGSSSYAAHLIAAATVIAIAAWLQVERLEWCLLAACIAAVLAAEAFNSALESLAKAVSLEEHPHLRDALDIGSGAVLIAAIAGAAIGAMIFIPRLLPLIGG